MLNLFFLLKGSLRQFVHCFEEVHDLYTTDGGVIVFEAQHRGGFEDNAFHYLFLDRSMGFV